jgi:broad specificity phosphatase PhoE
VRRLVLIRHATTDAVRRAAFPVDEPLDAGGRDAAEALAGRAGRGEALCSAALRARATAEALALDATPVAALAECDFGAWGPDGRSRTSTRRIRTRPGVVELLAA